LTRCFLLSLRRRCVLPQIFFWQRSQGVGLGSIIAWHDLPQRFLWKISQGWGISIPPRSPRTCTTPRPNHLIWSAYTGNNPQKEKHVSRRDLNLGKVNEKPSLYHLTKPHWQQDIEVDSCYSPPVKPIELQVQEKVEKVQPKKISYKLQGLTPLVSNKNKPKM